MYKVKNFTDNNDIQILKQMGPFTVIEYVRDLSVTPMTAQTSYAVSYTHLTLSSSLPYLGKSPSISKSTVIPSSSRIGLTLSLIHI